MFHWRPSTQLGGHFDNRITTGNFTSPGARETCLHLPGDGFIRKTEYELEVSEDEAGEEGDRLRIKFKLNGGGGEWKLDQTHDNSS